MAEAARPDRPSLTGLRLLPPAAFAAGLAALYVPALVHAVEVWRVDEELSFGFLLPVVAAGLVWLRWSNLRSSLGPGSSLGLPVLVAGLLLFVAAVRGGVSAAAGASFLPVALGAAAFLYGLPAARVLFAPTVFLTVGLSLFRGLFSALGFALQELTARFSAGLAAFAGLPVRRSGVDLFVGDTHFVVAQACSGMDSLLALLSLGLVVAALARAPWPRRLILLALVPPVVLATNVIRVTVVLALSQPFGVGIALGVAHQALSAAVFLSASLLLWSACVALRCLPRFDVTLS